MTKAHIGIWARIIVAIIGVLIFPYSVVTSFLCVSFIMMSASLRLIRASHPNSFFSSFLALFTGLTLGIIIYVSSVLIAALILYDPSSESFAYYFDYNIKHGMAFSMVTLLLIVFNTILCAINLFVQFYTEDYLMENQFKNKTIFMTGGTSGLGKVAALHALANGAHLILMVRNEEKGKQLQQTFASEYPKSTGQLTLINGNLSDLQSTVDVCTAVQRLNVELDQIVLNAGIMNFERKLSQNGIEETLQVNLLAPLLLIEKLHNLLNTEGNSKIIITASALHQGNINFNDIEFKENYSAFKVYRQSKLGTILLSRLLTDRFKNFGIYTQHPGVVKTELGRDAGWFSKFIFSLMGSSPKKGARTLIYLMESNTKNLSTGGYYAKKLFTTTTKQSYDMVMAEGLMEVCKEYLAVYLNENTPAVK